MNSIIIDGLIIEACLGVHDWEHHIAQTLVCDIELGVDIERAAASDKLQDTVDYVAICTAIEEAIKGRHFQLLETLVEHLAEMISQQFSVQWLSLYVRKHDAMANTRSVGVKVERGR